MTASAAIGVIAALFQPKRPMGEAELRKIVAADGLSAGWNIWRHNLLHLV
jgi:hypothetical protein